jgi:hypothetical protein
VSRPTETTNTVATPGTPTSRSAALAGAAAIALAFILAAALSWRKWPDILIDFGLQLYLPWKISTGSVLYRDVMYLTAGPLSQYYHALLFKCFGVSFRTIIVSNLVLTAGMLALLFRRFRSATDILTATMICLAIALVFAFNQYGDIGNYNFIAPYCHETVHGVFLSIVALVLLSEWMAREQVGFAFAAGACVGLVFLTKPEVFVALGLAVTGAFVLFAVNNHSDRLKVGARSFLVLLAGAAILLLAFTIYFHQFESWHESLRAVGFAWVPLFHNGVAGGPYYRWCLGLDTPGFHAMAMLKQFAVVVAVLTAFTFIFRRRMESSINRLVAIVGVAAVLATASAFDWSDCGRSLPLLDLIFVVLVCRNYRNIAQTKSAAFLIIWGIFAFFLTAKLGLFCRIWHYGFILAMPAFVSALALLLWLLPRLLEQKFSVNARVFRIAVALVLLLGFARLFVQSQIIYHDKNIALGARGDKMYASIPKYNPAGEALQSALPWLDQHAPPNATLAVLPEGIMVNYLSRRANPTRYLVWNPVEVAMFGSETMTATFERNAPDYIMLIHRDGAEYGAKYFGQQPEFGLELMQWIRKNYEPVYLIGHEPLQDFHFGISILKRHAN